ncbi:TPA: hypothetical protein ACIIUR_005345, partial [Klebsiella pneumoniae]
VYLSTQHAIHCSLGLVYLLHCNKASRSWHISLYFYIMNGFGIEGPKKNTMIEVRIKQVNQSHSSFQGLNNCQINPAAIVPQTTPPIRTSEIVECSIDFVSPKITPLCFIKLQAMRQGISY